MLLTVIGLVIFSVMFVFSVSKTKYHILCSGQCTIWNYLYLYIYLGAHGHF